MASSMRPGLDTRIPDRYKLALSRYGCFLPDLQVGRLFSYILQVRGRCRRAGLAFGPRPRGKWRRQIERLDPSARRWPPFDNSPTLCGSAGELEQDPPDLPAGRLYSCGYRQGP